MAASKTHLSKLVTRLCQLPAQEKDDFGVKPQDIRDELGKALERFAQSNEEATAIVDWLIFERPAESRKYRPGAGDIPEAATAVRDRDIEANTPQGCEKCEGTGRLYVSKRVKDVITGEPIDVDCQADCDCALGRFRVERKQAAGGAS